MITARAPRGQDRAGASTSDTAAREASAGTPEERRQRADGPGRRKRLAMCGYAGGYPYGCPGAD